MNEIFYYSLKKFFKNRGITQGQIASDLNCKEAFVNMMLNGRRTITRKTAIKMSELYGLKVSFLLTGEGEMCDYTTTTINIDNTNNGNKIDVENGEGMTIEQSMHNNDVVDKLLHELAEQRQQINKLITIITNQQNNLKGG